MVNNNFYKREIKMKIIEKQIKFNDVLLQHNGKDINIAQHHDNLSLGGKKVLCQEVAVLPDNDLLDGYQVHKFDGTLDSLINVLTEIKKDLEK
jgi:hypothetical protein|tara:strand:+ start:493 stop:771 length:279 start_codon:yes stop_codon:yes gene_type:complete